jgi:hypothetical protein
MRPDENALIVPDRVAIPCPALSSRSDLGRSQVVRQRILIPPFPGSNPGAPASVKALNSLQKLLCSRAGIWAHLEKWIPL